MTDQAEFIRPELPGLSVVGNLDAGSGRARAVPIADLSAALAAAAIDVRVITASGGFTVETDDTVIIINKSSASATAITLPAVATRSGVPVEIYDWKGNAGDLTFTPNGSEKIMNAATWVVASSSSAPARIRLTPTTDMSGWVVGWSLPAEPAVSFPRAGGRLSLVSGSDVITSDQTAKQNLYYAPSVGGRAPILSGGVWTFPQFVSGPTDQVGLTLALAGSANWAADTIHDVFAVLDSGVVKLGTRLWDSGMYPTETQITNATPITTGTGANSWANTANAFDANDSQASASCARIATSNNSIANCLGMDWGNGNDKTVSRIAIITPTDDGLRGDNPTPLRCHVSDSTDGTNWRLIQLVDLADSANGATHSIPINQAVRRAARYIRVAITGNGANTIAIAEMKFYQETPATSRRLTRYDGLLVNDASVVARIGASSTITVAQNEATFIGAIHIDTASNGQLSCHVDYGPARTWGVWNAYNQRPIKLRAGSLHTESSVTASYTYNLSSTVFTDMEASGLFEMEVLDGLGVDPIEAFIPRVFFIDAQTNTGSYTAGIGVDTKLSVSGKMISHAIDTTGQSMVCVGDALHTLRRVPGLRRLYGIEKKGGTGGTVSSYYTGEQLSLLEVHWMG